MKKQHLLIALALLVTLTSFGQPKYWERFTIKNSELGNNILAMTPDKKNSKWFGTEMGLAKLTGKTWTDFSMFNEKLKNQYINCLTVDSRNVLWIGTDDYGVIEFDGSRWTEHKEQMKKLQMKFISKIAIDRDNVKWIGVTLGGVVRYDGKDWKKYTSSTSELLSDFVLCVAVDGRNRKWIGTNAGLSIFDGNRWESYTVQNSKLPDNIVPAVLIDKDDVKWLATLGGLVRIKGETWTVYNTSNSPLPANQVNDLAFDPSGALWIVTDNGAALFDGKQGWHVYTAKNSILPKGIHRRVMVDGQGNKWFGSEAQGVTRLSAHPVMGRIVDDRGKPVRGISVSAGQQTATTDADGYYYLEVGQGSGVAITPADEMRNFQPPAINLTAVDGVLFGQDFVASSGMEAQGNGSERVVVNPYLDEGYITISMESPVAEVEFVGPDGKSVRKLPQYRNNAKITISKMPRIKYTLYIRTDKGEKKLIFNLK